MRAKTFPFAIFFIGAVAVIFGSQISTTGFGERSDIGPKAFPLLMGILLMLGGAYEFLKLFGPRQKQKDGPLDFLAQEAVPVKKSWKFWPVLAGIVVYLAAVPVAGFILSTIAFTFLMMKSLGTGWAVSVVSALAISLVVYGMFVLLFKVQLPGGVFFG